MHQTIKPAAHLPIRSHLANFIDGLVERHAQPAVAQVNEVMPDNAPTIDRAACEADLETFIRAILWTEDHVASPEVHKEWFQLATAPVDDPMFLDANGERIKFGSVIAAPRGHAKSAVFSFGTPIHAAITGRKRFVVVISDVQETATNFVDGIRREIEENPKIRATWPNLRTGEEMRPAAKWTSTDLVITMLRDDGTIGHQTRIVAKGARCRLRGIRFRHRRPDLIIGDDLENDELVGTPEQRRKTFDWLVKVVIPALDTKRGQLVIVGTILHYASLLSRLLTKTSENAVLTVAPEDRPQADDDEAGDDEDTSTAETDGFDPSAVFVQRRYQAILDYGGPTERPMWPEQFSLVKLRQIKKAVGSLAFMQEYQNNPIDEETRVVRPEWLRWWYKNEVRYESGVNRWYWRDRPLSIFIGVDPSIEEKATADWFAMVVVGITRRREIIVLKAYRGRMGLAEQVTTIQAEQARWDAQGVLVESNQAQKWLAQEIIRTGRWLSKVKVIKNNGNKFQRIAATSVWFDNGQVFMRAATEGTKDEPAEQGDPDETRTVRVHHSQQNFYEELVTYPHGAHDDLFDAFEESTRGSYQASGASRMRRSA